MLIRYNHIYLSEHHQHQINIIPCHASVQRPTRVGMFIVFVIRVYCIGNPKEILHTIHT